MKIGKFLHEIFMHSTPKMDEKRTNITKVLAEKMGLLYENGKIVKEDGDLQGRFIIETGASGNSKKEMYQIEDLPFLPDSEIEKIFNALKDDRYAVPFVNPKTKLAEVLIGKNVDANLKKVYAEADRIVGTVVTQEQKNENRVLNQVESVYSLVMDKMTSGNSRTEEEKEKKVENVKEEPTPERKVVTKDSASIAKENILPGSESPSKGKTSLEAENIKQEKKKENLRLQQELDENAQMLLDEAQTFDEKKSDKRKKDIDKMNS